MNISVLGCGRWGSFIAWYLSEHGHNVTLWGRKDSKNFNTIKETGENEYVKFNNSITLTDDLKVAVESSEVIAISISSQGLRGLIKDIVKLGYQNKTFILCMKGIEVDTGKRLSEVLTDEGIDANNIAVWVGPGHIQAFTKGLPNCMVIDSQNKDLVKYLADSFRSELIRFYYGDDLIGSEIGAAAKNVMGIAAGMLDGGGYTTLKGPLMARGAREVARLIKAMGGNELSAYGLCHLGDYETTLFSEYSNNRKFGENYVKKVPFIKLAEGVSTAKALKLLGDKYNVDLPITNAVYSILYDNKEPMQVFLTLFGRSARKEF
ncbi:MAG: NAD(P)H-dependent glycerol-3-phosphate dehydrogenase [Clostridia bacterium]|nr:NAD(P)H-dependent glycerol-3-phosphate dehydrogenase [Clostridia bacterium]